MNNDTVLCSKSDIVVALTNLKNSEFIHVVNNIKSGSFIRDESSKDYYDRLVYTKELRRFVYNPAILNIIFSDGAIKKLFFRTFGYKGQLDFTIYPNCWLRDLPLLDLGKGVYLGDGILLGTNQVSTDQKTIKAGSITIGQQSIFDQKCSLGYSSQVGEDCLIGFQVSIGMKCKIGNKVKLGPLTAIGHGVIIGDKVEVGSGSLIGSFASIENGVAIPEFSRIPSFSHVTRQGIYNRRQRAAEPTPGGRLHIRH